MPFDFRDLGKNLGDLANAAKDALEKGTVTPAQPAPAYQARPQPTAQQPQAPPEPMSDADYEPDYTTYGSAFLRFKAKGRLDTAVRIPSTEIIMGSTEPNGMNGVVWDLRTAPAHAMTFGPTRKGGKGVSAIIPGLLTYTAGSRLVIDPKGENYFAVKGRAEAAGHRVVLMDPWNEANRRYGSKVGVSEPVTKYNPLSSLDPGSRDFADDVAAVADALIIVPDSVNKHFDESARELVSGCIAAVVEAAPGKGSLRDVRELITLDDEELALRIKLIVEANPASLAGRKLRRFTKTNNEIASVRASATTQTAFLDSETLLDAMETDEPPFDLEELATGKVSLFLVLPVDRLETHGRWMRMIITLAIRAIARQDTPPENPVLFVLDEMGTIGRLSMVETAFGLMAGLGIRLWGFLQDLVQLQGLYPHTWETFISNSSVIQVLKAHDPTTSQYVSSYLGNGTVNAATGGRSQRTKPYGPGDSYSKRVIESMANYMIKFKHEKDMDAALERAKQVHTASGPYTVKPDGSHDYRDGPLISHRTLTLHESTTQRMRDEGIGETGYTEWQDDMQLVGRPLLDADEVRRMGDSHCLILLPGSRPIAQYRTIYYKHPLFAGLYRANPYFEKPAMPPSPAPNA